MNIKHFAVFVLLSIMYTGFIEIVSSNKLSSLWTEVDKYPVANSDGILDIVYASIANKKIPRFEEVEYPNFRWFINGDEYSANVYDFLVGAYSPIKDILNKNEFILLTGYGEKQNLSQKGEDLHRFLKNKIAVRSKCYFFALIIFSMALSIITMWSVLTLKKRSI